MLPPKRQGTHRSVDGRVASGALGARVQAVGADEAELVVAHAHAAAVGLLGVAVAAAGADAGVDGVAVALAVELAAQAEVQACVVGQALAGAEGREEHVAAGAVEAAAGVVPVAGRARAALLARVLGHAAGAVHLHLAVGALVRHGALVRVLQVAEGLAVELAFPAVFKARAQADALR